MSVVLGTKFHIKRCITKYMCANLRAFVILYSEICLIIHIQDDHF